jgi:hypothetical protein
MLKSHINMTKALEITSRMKLRVWHMRGVNFEWHDYFTKTFMSPSIQLEDCQDYQHTWVQLSSCVPKCTCYNWIHEFMLQLEFN